jgi:REP element-mobilizing transposase RayT
MINYPVQWPVFYTATILDWKPLLKEDAYKMIVIKSLNFLVSAGKIKLYAFVIMNNHIHLIWQVLPNNDPERVRHSFMKFTAHHFLYRLRETNVHLLESFRVESKDRQYQFWKRNALSVELFSPKVYLQKLNYIHQNPVKAGYCLCSEDYHYSSATFYKNGKDVFGIMKYDEN